MDSYKSKKQKKKKSKKQQEPPDSEFKYNVTDVTKLVRHLNETFRKIRDKGDVKLMRVKPQNSLPLSHRQMYIKKKYGRLCQADTRFSQEQICKDKMCPCPQFESLCSKELHTFDEALEQNRHSFIDYLLTSYKDIYSPSHKLRGEMAIGDNLYYLIHLIADKLETPVCPEDCQYKCIMALHCIIPYVPYLTTKHLVTMIFLGNQNENWIDQATNKTCLDQLTLPMLKYWIADEEFGPTLATICGEIMYYDFINKKDFDDLNFSIEKFLESSMFYVLEYICPNGHAMFGAEKQLDILIMYHCILLKFSQEDTVNALVIQNLKKIKATMSFMYVEEAYGQNRVSADICGTFMDYIEYTNVPVNVESQAVSMERPGAACCKKHITPEELLEQKRFDTRLKILVAKEQMIPNWIMRRERWKVEVLEYDDQLRSFGKKLINDKDYTVSRLRARLFNNQKITKSSQFDEETVKLVSKINKLSAAVKTENAEKGDVPESIGTTQTSPNGLGQIRWADPDKMSKSDAKKSSSEEKVTKINEIGIQPKNVGTDPKNVDEQPKKTGTKPKSAGKKDKVKQTWQDCIGDIPKKIHAHEDTHGDLGVTYLSQHFASKGQHTTADRTKNHKTPDTTDTMFKEQCTQDGTKYVHFDKGGVMETNIDPNDELYQSHKRGLDMFTEMFSKFASNNDVKAKELHTKKSEKSKSATGKAYKENDVKTQDKAKNITKKDVPKDQVETSKKKKIRRCALCLVSEEDGQKFRKCGGCRKMTYCSQECQREHWKEGHKLSCQNMQ